MDKQGSLPRPSVKPFRETGGLQSSKWIGTGWLLAKISACLSLLIFVAVGSYALALVSAESLLVERDTPAKADVIVVLGGDGRPRAERAAALWLDGRAPAILATGYGDCEFIRQVLIAADVEPSAIKTECRSQTTWDNATFSQPILATMHVSRAILVTSWFHSKRATNRFRSLMPGIQWISVPAERKKSYWALASDPDGSQIAKEYAKTIAYDLRTRIAGAGVAAPSGRAPKTSRLP